jgi:endonuclease/exonuclease/phosphatase family metal-dependent hydrolase
MTSIRIITLNIEGDKHLDIVICLQEVFEKDVEQIKKSLSMNGEFIPCMYINEENVAHFSPGNVWGIMVLTNLLEYSISKKYYSSYSSELPELGYKNPNAAHRVLFIIDVRKQAQNFRIITTHFTWTPDGNPLPLQFEHMEAMLSVLNTFDEFVLCGDFNAPRGGEVWKILAKKYTDTIPPNITTTLDPNIHRTKNLELVVDGIFSTPKYSVTNVAVRGGLSDHKAIIATIIK